MLIAEAIKSVDFDDVVEYLIGLHGAVGEGVQTLKEDYRLVHQSLQQMPGVTRTPQMRVYVEKGEDGYCDVFGQDGEVYDDTHGVVKDLLGRTVSWALEFMPWKEWLASELVMPEGMSLPEVVAHVLFEMTFFGYSDDVVEEASERIAGAYSE